MKATEGLSTICQQGTVRSLPMCKQEGISGTLHEARHLRGDIISYNTAIDGCQRRWSLSLAVLAKMSQQNLQPDVIAHDTASFWQWQCVQVLHRSFAALRPLAPPRKGTTGIVPWTCYGPSRPALFMNDLTGSSSSLCLYRKYMHLTTSTDA